ncbi:hypothetical protein PJE062_1056 [Pseudovibrio sp. JE062]|nr:hypothetical protein PJE062_1056 [Pseudovibrio sp. JE062]
MSSAALYSTIVKLFEICSFEPVKTPAKLKGYKVFNPPQF